MGEKHVIGCRDHQLVTTELDYFNMQDIVLSEMSMPALGHSPILYNGYRGSLAGVKLRGRRVEPLTSSRCQGKEWVELYRVIRKSLRDFRTRLRNNQDRHGRKEHINR